MSDVRIQEKRSEKIAGCGAKILLNTGGMTVEDENTKYHLNIYLSLFPFMPNSAIVSFVNIS